MRILVTGAAGFIGAAVSRRLVDEGFTVLGIDNLSPYYDVSLKQARLERLRNQTGFYFEKVDVADRVAMEAFFRAQKPTHVIHLAAQAGVRYSLTHAHPYIDANVTGMLNILEGCRHNEVQHLVYASSSSVYGSNSRMPLAVTDTVDHPVSLYAATKRCGELMAHSYSHLFRVPTTGLRFFTVYGPWGRPDMSLFLFTKQMLAGQPIDLFDYGNHRRAFTYIDDIVEGVVRVVKRPAAADANWSSETPTIDRSSAPFRLYNIGGDSPRKMTDIVSILEKVLGVKAIVNPLPMQPGDVFETVADVQQLKEDFDFQPATPIEEGLPRFVDWYRSYFRSE